MKREREMCTILHSLCRGPFCSGITGINSPLLTVAQLSCSPLCNSLSSSCSPLCTAFLINGEQKGLLRTWEQEGLLRTWEQEVHRCTHGSRRYTPLHTREQE